MVATASAPIGPQLPNGSCSAVSAARSYPKASPAVPSEASALIPICALHPGWQAPQPVGTGLANLGNTCYMNATLQCLAHVPALGNLALRNAHSRSCCGCLSGAAVCVACLVEQQLSTQLRGSSGGLAVGPWAIVRNLPLLGRTLVKGRQEDAHEFLLAVLDAVDRDMRRDAVARGMSKAAPTFVDHLFVGRFCSQVLCQRCGFSSNSYEPFACLSLDVAGRTTGSVEEALAAFTKPEVLDGPNAYRCDRCSMLVQAVKQTTIHDDPNVLTLHLKRFDTLVPGGKITRHIRFADVIDLSPHLSGDGTSDAPCRQTGSSNGASTHSPVSNGSSLEASTNSGGNSPMTAQTASKYMLWGVLVHAGFSVHSGHYFAYVRDSRGNWWCVNDCNVYSVSKDLVLGQQAYILFYARTTIKAPRSQPTTGLLQPSKVPVPVDVPDPLAEVLLQAVSSSTAYGPQLPPGVCGPQPPPASEQISGIPRSAHVAEPSGLQAQAPAVVAAPAKSSQANRTSIALPPLTPAPKAAATRIGAVGRPTVVVRLPQQVSALPHLPGAGASVAMSGTSGATASCALKRRRGVISSSDSYVPAGNGDEAGPSALTTGAASQVAGHACGTTPGDISAELGTHKRPCIRGHAMEFARRCPGLLDELRSAMHTQCWEAGLSLPQALQRTDLKQRLMSSLRERLPLREYLALLRKALA